MGNNSHLSKLPVTQDRNNAMSDDPGDGHCLAHKPDPVGPAPVENKKRRHDEQNQATIEELEREGLGIAAKE